MKITPRRELLARNGITMPQFNECVSVGMAAEVVSQVYEGGRSYNLVVRAADTEIPFTDFPHIISRRLYGAAQHSGED